MTRIKKLVQINTFEKTAGVLLVKGKEGTGDLTDTGNSQLDTPDFTLVTER